MNSTQLSEVGCINTAAREQSLIEALCPTGVVVAACYTAEVSQELFPEEALAVATALETRRQEFLKGRACARQAMVRLGADPVPIPVLPDRGPQWPAGIVGSITHTSDLACAAVAWKHACAGIGIDVETRDHELRTTLDRFVCTPAERAGLQTLPEEIDPLRLVFSAKESVHKCVAPVAGITLGFHEVELDIDVANQRFSARVLRRDAVIPDFSLLSGRFVVTPRFVITTAIIPAGHGNLGTIPSASTMRV
ncbi:MAG TPA: 4'-phosphopantetheinyl transferase superfamily protein [Longimicrobiales bacterium]